MNFKYNLAKLTKIPLSLSSLRNLGALSQMRTKIKCTFLIINYVVTGVMKMLRSQIVLMKIHLVCEHTKMTVLHNLVWLNAEYFLYTDLTQKVF